MNKKNLLLFAMLFFRTSGMEKPTKLCQGTWRSAVFRRYGDFLKPDQNTFAPGLALHLIQQLRAFPDQVQLIKNTIDFKHEDDFCRLQIILHRNMVRTTHQEEILRIIRWCVPMSDVLKELGNNNTTEFDVDNCNHALVNILLSSKCGEVEKFFSLVNKASTRKDIATIAQVVKDFTLRHSSSLRNATADGQGERNKS